ncbi:hypothetical protein QQP08_007544 [Theobroma cacao]|nr:hypothetical protein QQP08_007544 [Theobroma cacao]
MAPRRPLPMGRASVQYLAGSLKVTLSGLEVELWESEGTIELGFKRSDTVGRRTRTHSSSPIAGNLGTTNFFYQYKLGTGCSMTSSDNIPNNQRLLLVGWI